MSLKRVWMPSPNYSQGYHSRRLVVLHTSEGAQTYQSLGNFFANPSSQVSSHVGIDDTRGTIGEYVRNGNSAWTAGNANMQAVQAELCTPSGAAANWTESIWKNQHANMLANTAEWVREECTVWGIPITGLTPGQAQGTGRGVCQHSDLGAWGGGHYDCGDGFPMDYVLSMARGESPPEEPTVVKLLYFGEAMSYIPDGPAGTSHALTWPANTRILRFGCVVQAAFKLDWVGDDIGNPPSIDFNMDGHHHAQFPLPTTKCKMARFVRKDDTHAEVMYTPSE